jgi:hypothetical protein
LALLLGTLASSCASERAPINRVQPNALDKTFFVGALLSDPSDNPEFYYRPTVVDVDYGAGQDGLFTASYAQTLARVGFEITEDLLVARLTYERIADSSGKGSPDDNAGQIVAAFKISSHFDIKHGYNPQTGEELNVVEENSTDLPWYQRKFMRVDWSQNLVTSAYQLDTLAALKAYSDQAIQYEPASYSVQDPENPDAPVFSPEEGYFDITNKVFAKPQLIDTPFGTFPACFFNADFFNGSGPVANCNPVELKVRLSFRRVVDRDYEPVDWDGQRMAMFGAFTTGTLSPDRLGYDRNYGLVDSKWYRFAGRHNIWATSHVRDDAGALKACTADSECDGKKGSHCDLFRHACTLPYRERSTRPVAYYYGPGSDPTLFETATLSAKDWDSALRHAVQTARYAECVHEGGGPENVTERAACLAAYPTSLEGALDKVGQILVLCHNPVTEDDPSSCGAPGTAPRVGDLRYNMANIIQSPQLPSPWGIMADADDPLTGEVVAASVNVWNASTDIVTQRTLDLMRWYMGELSTSDVTQGNYVRDLNLAPAPGSKLAWRGPTPMASDEVEGRIAAMDQSLFDPKNALTALPDLDASATLDWATAVTRKTYGDSVLGQGNAGILARFAALKGSPVEAALTTEPYLSLAGLDSNTPLDAATLGAVSPLRGGYWQNRVALERQRQLFLAQAGSCVMAAAEPSGAIEVAQKLLKKFPVVDRDPSTPEIELSAADLTARNLKWSDYLRKHLTRGVLAHEMGHSMGLRHVFTSSFDALNYRPQYWQLRTRDKQETAYCTSPTADGKTCIGPRWNDPITQTEREGLLTTWQQTSVMDYPGEISQDTLDIGAYDRAAIRFLYADVADMWDDPSAQCPINVNGVRACDANGDLLAGQLDRFGGIQGAWYGVPKTPIHYSKLDQQMNLIRDCKPADTAPPADWDEAQNGIYDPVLDGHIVNGTTCSGIPTDYVRYADLAIVNTANDGAVRKFDSANRVRRPYMFASDEYADIGNISVYRDDNGADAYEVASFLINESEDRHVFDNHRRGRTTFTLSAALMRSFSRYHDKLKEMGKGFALLNEIYAGSNLLTQVTTGALGDALSKPHALATSLTFDNLTRMLTRPSAGEHFLDTSVDAVDKTLLRSTDQSLVPNQPGRNQSSVLVIPEGTQHPGLAPAIGGRPLHNALDGSKGYYATQYDLWIGSYYEKTLAIDLLSDSVDRFISQSRDDFIDGRYRNVSFATLFPEGVRRLVANSLTEDSDLLAWRIPVVGTRPRVEAGTSEPLAPLGFHVWWPQSGPTMCWPAPGQLGCGDVSSGLGNTPAPAASLGIDPELGFEVQKFVALYSLLYLPESWKRDWVDLSLIFQFGVNADPQFSADESVTFVDPISGEAYVARSYGKETIDGRSVERGIGGRVLEWANTLAASAYEVVGTDPKTGRTEYAKYADDSSCPPGVAHCTGQSVLKSQPFATRLRNYKSVIDFMQQLAGGLGFYGPSWRGIR